MAYTATVGAKIAPTKKKKPKATTDSAASAIIGPQKQGGGYTSTNMTSNSRAGQKYRTETRAGGVVHVYESGKRVFVKKKKANPSRSFM